MSKPPILTVDGIAQAVRLSERAHWIGALDPTLRTFDIILKTANGTSYNAYVIRGSAGVAIIDTVKENFAADFFARLESVARYDEIKVIVLNHLEPDHTGALPELMRRAPQARLYISQKAQSMLKALLKQDAFAFTPVLPATRYRWAIAPWNFFTPLICIGRIPNTLIWWKKKPCFQA